MSAKPRQPSSTDIYHVVLTSINHMQIFEEDEDYRKFLFILFDCEEKYESPVYAYCLMSNHIHLILDSPFPQLSQFIQNLLIRFVQWYNRKYDRVGSLMQANFFSSPIETERYLLCAIRYVHDNPVKANMCRFATEYQWSSSRAYYEKKNNLLYLDRIIEIFGSLEYVQHLFSEITDDELNPELFEPKRKEKPVVEDHAKSIYHSTTGCITSFDFQKLPKKQRNNYIRLLKKQKLTLDQISRLTGVSRRTISRILHNYSNPK